MIYCCYTFSAPNAHQPSDKQQQISWNFFQERIYNDLEIISKQNVFQLSVLQSLRLVLLFTAEHH